MINAKDFSSRQQLEAFVANKYGLTVEDKKDTIAGTKEELNKLNLSHKTSVWGIRCVETNYSPPQKFDKPLRGEIHKYSIK